MRALKSVLAMAGAAQRGPEGACGEDAALIAAIRQVNLPKLTTEVGRRGRFCRAPNPWQTGSLLPAWPISLAAGWGAHLPLPRSPPLPLTPSTPPQDAVLFEAIITDLFPAAPRAAEGARTLRAALARALEAAGQQPAEATVSKAVQLHETLEVRFGVMLIGPAGGSGALGGREGLRQGVVPGFQAMHHPVPRPPRNNPQAPASPAAARG
jgi:hypothetical protein